MNQKIADRADSISEHALVKLWARLAQIIGIPVAVGLLLYIGPVFVEMRDGMRTNTQTISSVVIPTLEELKLARDAVAHQLAERTRDRFSSSAAKAMEDRILYELRKEIARLSERISALEKEARRNG